MSAARRTPRARIDTLDLMTTTACNLSCRWCYGHMECQPQQHMDLQTAIAATHLALDNLDPRQDEGHLSVMFFGGEPLLNWQLVHDYTCWIRGHETLSSRPLSLELFTNGVLLDEPKVQFLTGNGIRVYLSLDGPFEDQIVRRPMTAETHARVVDNLRLLVSHSDPGRAPIVYTVVTRDRLHRAAAVIDFVAGLGVRNLQISRDLDEDLSLEQRRFLMGTVRGYMAANPEMSILFNPENSSRCGTCEPKAVLVFPDGEIYDLCMVCVAALVRRGVLTESDLRVMHFGTLGSVRELRLDVEAKRRLITSRVFCPTIHREPRFADSGRDL